MASPAAPATKVKASPLFPEEILEEIFLRLPTPTDLVWASATCACFRRIITDRSFLCRFRALHRPALLGFVNRDGFHTTEAPHPYAPLGRALAVAADFSYSFVPVGRCLEPWCLCDMRQGRVLLKCFPEFTLDEAQENKFLLGNLELAVYDPLALRYVLLPSIPEDITAPHKRLFQFESFLAPNGENEDTSFRVICKTRNAMMLFAFVFTSATGQWHLAAAPSFSSLGTSPHPCSIPYSSFHFVRDCIYWTGLLVDKLLVLDLLSMEFSIVNNTPFSYLRWEWVSRNTHILASEHGTPLMLFLSNHDDVSGDQLHITKMNVSEPAD